MRATLVIVSGLLAIWGYGRTAYAEYSQQPQGATPAYKQDVKPMAGERMSEANRELVNAINPLIEISKDGEYGYTTAADGVKDAGLKGLFTRYANQRTQFAKELRADVLQIGGNPDETGTVTGAVHRGWINLKSAVTAGDDVAILRECERVDTGVLKTYDAALQKHLPAGTRSTVERQRAAIQDALESVRGLLEKRS